MRQDPLSSFRSLRGLTLAAWVLLAVLLLAVQQPQPALAVRTRLRMFRPTTGVMPPILLQQDGEGSVGEAVSSEESIDAAPEPPVEQVTSAAPAVPIATEPQAEQPSEMQEAVDAAGDEGSVAGGDEEGEGSVAEAAADVESATTDSESSSSSPPDQEDGEGPVGQPPVEQEEQEQQEEPQQQEETPAPATLPPQPSETAADPVAEPQLQEQPAAPQQPEQPQPQPSAEVLEPSQQETPVPHVPQPSILPAAPEASAEVSVNVVPVTDLRQLQQQQQQLKSLTLRVDELGATVDQVRQLAEALQGRHTEGVAEIELRLNRLRADLDQLRQRADPTAAFAAPLDFEGLMRRMPREPDTAAAGAAAAASAPVSGVPQGFNPTVVADTSASLPGYVSMAGSGSRMRPARVIGAEEYQRVARTVPGQEIS